VFDEKPVDQPRTPGAGLRSVVSGPRRRRARGAPPGGGRRPARAHRTTRVVRAETAPSVVRVVPGAL